MNVLSSEMEERARALHRDAFVFDAAMFGGGLTMDEDGEVQALIRGGLSGVALTVGEPGWGFHALIDRIAHIRRMADRHRNHVRLCRSSRELEECKRDGKVGVVIHFQDPKPIENDLANLATFWELGLRVLQLTYNSQGYVGTGCCERHESGLSYFGLDVLAECNRLKILVDLSHCCDETAWDAIKHSKSPVAFTHVGAYRLCPAHGRNKSDELLKAVVDTGGVVGATFFPSLVKRDPITQEVLQADIEDYLDVVDYMVELVGADNVGIGSDLSNYHARTLEVPPTSSIRWYRPRRPDVYGVGPVGRYDPFPTNLDSHAKMLNVTRGLVSRGYTDKDIRGVLGGNWLRLFREVWGE